MRPNPYLVDRQPLAKVRGNIVRADSDTLDLDAEQPNGSFQGLVRLIESADLITEGAKYLSEEPAKFYGSAVLTVRRLDDEWDATSMDPPQLLEDPRLRRLIEGRLFREMMMHLGAEASANFEWQGRETLVGNEHRVIMDFECTLAVSSTPEVKAR